MIKLLLIDSHAICHRAYHALPKTLTSQGRPINVAYGFFSMLLKAIEELKPTHLAICFDTPHPTFRHLKFIGYQAKRPKTEIDLKEQIKLVQNVLREVDFPNFSLEGYEADDLLGTIAKKVTRRKAKAIIVTSDRDLTQLVDNRINLFVPISGFSKTKIFDAKEVKESLGVDPEKIVDYKGLVGDNSDNYPGVSGIGPKTAVSLLSRFHDLETIYKSLDKIDTNVATKLKRDREAAFLSQELARIKTDAPIEFSLKVLRWDQEKETKMTEILRKLNFKSLLTRVKKLNQAKNQETQMQLL